MSDLRRGHSPSTRRKASSAGFIQTLEFLVLLSIFGVVILYGLQMVQQWFLEKINFVTGEKIFIFDASVPPKLIGKAIGFNQEQAPLVALEFNQGGVHTRAILGVRNTYFAPPFDNNVGLFTSQQAVFYRNTDCTGQASVLNPTMDQSSEYERLVQGAVSIPVVTNTPFPNPAPAPGDNMPGTGTAAGTIAVTDWGYIYDVSDFYGLQGYVYAIGRTSPGNDQNHLYRAALTAANPALVPQSAFVSRKHSAVRCINLVAEGLPQPATTLLLATGAPIDDLDAAGGYDFAWQPDPAFVGYWVPVSANGTLPAGYTMPQAENTLAQDTWIEFTTATAEDSPPQ